MPSNKFLLENALPEEIYQFIHTLAVPICVLKLTDSSTFYNLEWQNATAFYHLSELINEHDYQDLISNCHLLSANAPLTLSLKLKQALNNGTHLQVKISLHQTQYAIIIWTQTHQTVSNIGLQLLIDSLEDGIFAIDTHFNFMAFNQAIRRSHLKRFGQEPQIGENFFSNMPIEEALFMRHHFQIGFTKNVYPFILTRESLDNKSDAIVLQVHTNSLKNEKGDVIGLCVTGHNISNLTKLEKQLIESEEKLQGIITAVDNLVFVFNEKCEYEHVWVRDENSLFLPKEELLGKRSKGILPDTFSDMYESAIQKVLQTGETISLEYASPVAHNNRYYSAVFTLVKINGKSLRKVAVSVRDITEKQLVQDEKEHLLQEVILKNRNLEQFTYIVSHNMRSPLARIMGLASILDKKNPLSDFNQTILSKLTTECENMDSVLKDLNIILNIRKNNQEIINKIALNESFFHVFDAVKADNTLEIELETDFSDAPNVLGIRGYLHSVFYNLISNAIKYRDSQRKLCICCTSQLVNDMVLICFSDNGIGIEQHHLKTKLFGLYQRFHNHVAGKGLGLHITKSQIEMMDGTIEVESEVGKGTTFYIYLKSPEK